MVCESIQNKDTWTLKQILWHRRQSWWMKPTMTLLFSHHITFLTVQDWTRYLPLWSIFRKFAITTCWAHKVLGHEESQLTIKAGNKSNQEHDRVVHSHLRRKVTLWVTEITDVSKITFKQEICSTCLHQVASYRTDNKCVKKTIWYT